MASTQKLLHLLIPFYLSVVYIYFIVMLNRYLYISVIGLLIFGILLFFYFLRAYALLHYKPKMTKNIKQLQQHVNTQKIFEYKKTQQQIKSLKQTIKGKKRSKISPEVISKYMQLYQQTSYCDYCQCLKPSRAYHCFQCNGCVLRRQKHSDLICRCVGEGNIKPFIQYMFIAMIISGYMTLTLIAVTIYQRHQLNSLSTLQLLTFALQQMFLLSSLLLFIKQFTISYFNAKNNITETERKENIIDPKNNPFNQKDFYHEIFTSRLEYLSIHNVGDYSEWLEVQEEH